MLAALIGALAGVLGSVFFQFLFTRWRQRAEVALAVIDWANGMNRRVVDLSMQKAAVYSGSKNAYLTPEEYDKNSRSIRDELIFSNVPAKLRLAYGECEELGWLNGLIERLQTVVRNLWRSTAVTWKQTEQDMKAAFKSDIDPLRVRLQNRLLERADPPGLLVAVETLAMFVMRGGRRSH